MSGILYLTGTPIGNLEDISYRCIRILTEADLVLAEDTRQTQKLLNHYQIKNKLTSYHEHNKDEKQDHIINLLLSGKNIALVTDAGMPGISDPGEDLARACRANGITVTTVPGPTALVSGLILSGQCLKEFLFLGFLPADKKLKEQKLEELKDLPYTLIFYEAPHKLNKTLAAMAKVIGSNRQISLTRELTKKYEEVLCFSLEEAISYFQDNQPRGEYVLILAGKDRQQIEDEVRVGWENMSWQEHYHFYLEQGLEDKQILKQMAKDRGIGKREVYQYFHKK
ncbi:16S rRNA (cytidine(1402)-2'-O)-methyltransferase [Clostridiales bacterium COT073_COT-073]|nr:16S rRNA (cytidine(1402)-2'-O)-methyltransferase [Clostridiales bacterium COT073_COT-073]